MNSYKGSRVVDNPTKSSITIFFMSFVYPAHAGYLKRMDLLIRWVEKRFSTVNFIIPDREKVSLDVIHEHLKYCNNLFLVDDKQPKFQKLLSVQKLVYKLLTGRYPKFDSTLFLNKPLINSFSRVINENKTDYFLNTRNNFGGLISFIPSGIKTIFDTQDIFTDMHRKYGMYGKPEWTKKYLIGYKEKGDFIKSELEILKKYDTIIAISENDFNKYNKLEFFKSKIVKIDSIGIEVKTNPTAISTSKQYDALIVASNFIGTQNGINWFFNEVSNHFSKTIKVCIIGSIGEYIIENKLFNSNLEVDIKGYVDSLDIFYEQSKIVALCILEGTGSSVKGIEALCYGAAIVSTTAGVRFGSIVNGKHCVINDSPKEFALSIEKLIANEDLRNLLGENALKYAKENFSLSSTFTQFDNCIH